MGLLINIFKGLLIGSNPKVKRGSSGCPADGEPQPTFQNDTQENFSGENGIENQSVDGDGGVSL